MRPDHRPQTLDLSREYLPQNRPQNHNVHLLSRRSQKHPQPQLVFSRHPKRRRIRMER